ncbi:hypothetical protein MTO96_031537 [Rhipicephalus appendiculatus]
MGHKRDYSRKANLQFIADTLKAVWGVQCMINSRDDVLVQNAFKISGTAAKIGHLKAYHHCTVLVDVNTTVLHQVLGGRYSNIDSKASPSVRASVMNLKELCPRLTVESLSASLAARFIRQHEDEASSLDLGDALGLNAVVKVALTSYHGLLEDIRVTPSLRDRELLPVIRDGIRGVRFLQSDIAEAFRKIRDSNPGNSALLEFLGKCCSALAGNALR